MCQLGTRCRRAHFVFLCTKHFGESAYHLRSRCSSGGHVRTLLSSLGIEILSSRLLLCHISSYNTCINPRLLFPATSARPPTTLTMRIPLFILTFLFSLFSLATTPVAADSGVLYTDAVTYCAEAKAVIVDEFDITYHRSNGSVTFSFSLASVESNLNTSVNLYINAYGIQIINQTLELCELLQGVICPLPQVNFTGMSHLLGLFPGLTFANAKAGYGTYPIPEEYLSKIPSIAYTVPNIEAYARVQLIRVENNEVAACLQATLANGKTAHQKGVIWASAMFTLVAFLVAIWHTASGTSTSPIQYRWFDILFIFQAAAASGLLHLNYPLVYTNFVQNFHWALGLFYSSNMQSSIKKMREKTGGSMDSTAYSDVQYINRKLSPYNVYISNDGILSSPESLAAFFKENALSKRSLEHFAKRATIPSVLPQNVTTDINTGLPVYTNTLKIPEANAYDTIWFVFLALIGIFVAFHVLLFGIVFLFDRMGRNRSHLGWAARLRRMWWPFCIGNSLRLVSFKFSEWSNRWLISLLVPYRFLPHLDLCLLAIPHWRLWSFHFLGCIRYSPHPRPSRHSLRTLPSPCSTNLIHVPRDKLAIHFFPLLSLYRCALPPIPPEIPLLLVRPVHTRHDRPSRLYRVRPYLCVGSSNW